MKYIVHHRYKGPAADGVRVNLPYGAVFETVGPLIATPEGRGICFPTSEVAHRHFAVYDDGRGLERGALTHAIAYGQRARKWPDGSVHRFSEAEAELLARKWGHWLWQDADVILFNEDFFTAKPEEVRRLADELKIRVRR